MSNYVKPQSPLYNKNSDTYVYPLTTADQVILSNGDRLDNYTNNIKLNYSVVGGLTEPENPTQNMIWVQTDADIQKVYFSDLEPNVILNEGDLWIYTGTSSNVSFQALQINNDFINTIHPLFAKQYVSGAWVYKEAQIYQNGEWMSAWDGLLYNAGDEYETITGGWKQQGSTGTFTKNANSININIGASGSAATTTSNKINLTGKTKATINVTEYGAGAGSQGQFGFTKTNTSITIPPELGYITIQSTGTFTLDISGIDGEYYPTVLVGGAAYVGLTFDKIKLE